MGRTLRVATIATTAVVSMTLVACSSSTKSAGSGASSAAPTATASTAASSAAASSPAAASSAPAAASSAPAAASSAPAAAASSGGASAAVPFSGSELGLPNSYPAPTKPTGSFTVGYMNIFAAVPALKSSQDAAQAEVQKLGGKFIAKDDQLDVTTQVNHCNELIAEKVNIILLYPLDPKALQPCFTAAAAAGIIVVPQNAPVAADQPLIATLKTDVVQGFDYNAYLRAQAISKVDPGGSYVIIGLAAPVAALTYYAQRQRYWNDKFGLKFAGEIDAQTDNAAGASTAMAAIIAKYPNAKNVFTYNDNTALAAATTAKASGKSSDRILGSNGQTAAVAAVKSGELYGTTWVDFPAIGRNQADAGIDLFNKSGTLPPFATTAEKFVTQADAGSVTPVG